MPASKSQDGGPPGSTGVQRREMLRTVAGGAAAGALAAPYVSNAQTAAGISLKLQTVWSAGGIGQQIFETWCHSMIERTSGELALVPFAADDVAGIFEMMDAVAGGVLVLLGAFTKSAQFPFHFWLPPGPVMSSRVSATCTQSWVCRSPRYFNAAKLSEAATT